MSQCLYSLYLEWHKCVTSSHCVGFIRETSTYMEIKNADHFTSL